MNLSLMTHSPRFSAGRISASQCSDLAAANNKASVRIFHFSSWPRSKSSRIVSAPGVPPGSRVRHTLKPLASKAAARALACVDFPVPSPPSRLMNCPVTFRSRKAEQGFQTGPDTVKETGLFDGFPGDERHSLRPCIVGGNNQRCYLLALLDRCFYGPVITDFHCYVTVRTFWNTGKQIPRRDEVNRGCVTQLNLGCLNLCTLFEKRFGFPGIETPVHELH